MRGKWWEQLSWDSNSPEAWNQWTSTVRQSMHSTYLLLDLDLFDCFKKSSKRWWGAFWWPSGKQYHWAWNSPPLYSSSRQQWTYQLLWNYRVGPKISIPMNDSPNVYGTEKIWSNWPVWGQNPKPGLIRMCLGQQSNPATNYWDITMHVGYFRLQKNATWDTQHRGRMSLNVSNTEKHSWLTVSYILVNQLK